jgi:endonuclease YncB( thermonuclease family)
VPEQPFVSRGLASLSATAALLTLLLATAGGAAGAVAPQERLRDIRPERQLWGTVVDMARGSELVIRTPEDGPLAVRFLGIELPEPPAGTNGSGSLPGQPFAEEAAAYARSLLLNKQVLLEPHGKDRQGRLLAVVYLGEINVNLTLVKEGLAWVSPGKVLPKVRVPLEVAERQAQVARYGLWSLPDPEPPWQFRKRTHRPGD